jgi:UDP-N-acetylmuramoyl-tripeptide--D-alanyl-D-alanine ligase
VQPAFAVITNVGQVHMEHLDNTRRGVLRAKCEIFENLKPDGVAVLNGDDDLLREVKSDREILFCGLGENCRVRVTDVEELGIEGLRCTVTTPADVYHVRVTAPGAYMIYPVSMAIAIAERLGMTKEEILAGIADFRSVGSRMHLIHMPEDRLIIDDCYNANPQSMAAGLQILAKTPGRHVAVLGDMGELGAASRSAHARMGQLAEELGIDVLIAIGVKAKDMTENRTMETYWFATVEEAEETLRRQFTPGTAVLVKASHSMAFERITELLEKQ